jgi:hypothetical protein
MLRNHSKSDKKNDGYIQKIHADDFNDIVDIIWGGGDQMMNVRSNVEERSKGIFLRSKIIVIPWIERVEKNKDKQCSIEPMTRELYNIQR